MERKGVVALGNPFRGDDGISTVLARELDNEYLPSNIEIFDAGTGGIKVLHILEKLDKVILVDAVFFGGEPGEYVFFKSDEIESLKASGGSHDSNIFEVLELSKELHEGPDEVLLMGIQPKDVSMHEELSEELKEKVPVLLAELRKKIIDI